MTEDDKARRRPDWALPYLLFAVVVVVVFFPALFGDAVIGGHHDRGDQMIPFYAAFSRAFKAGQVPQWNPYVFCGKSMTGSGMFVFFYPLYWAVFALPESELLRSTTFVLVVHVALALVGSFLLFRRLGADPFWATVSALAYVFSANATLQMATELNFASFVYPPIVIWLVAGQHRDRLVGNAAAQAAAYALLLLSSNVQLVLYTVAACLAYSLFAATVLEARTARIRVDWPRLAACAAAFAGGCAIAAARWVPFYVASRAQAGAPILYAEFLSTSPMEWSDFVRFVMPEFFGTDGYADFYGHINHFESLGGYASLLGAALTVHGLLRWNRRNAFWNAWLVITVLVVIDTPLTWLHYVATGRTMLHFTRVAWLAPLPCAALVALEGRDFFADVSAHTWRFLGWFGGASLFLAGGAYRRLAPPERAALGDQTRDALVLFLVLLAVLVILAFVARRFGEGSRVFRGALLLTVLFDLFTVFHHEANTWRPFLTSSDDFVPSAQDESAAREVSEPTRLFRVFSDPANRNVKDYGRFTLNDRWILMGAYSSSGYDNSAPRKISQLYRAPNGGAEISRVFERVIYPTTLRTAEITSTKIAFTGDDTERRAPAALPRVRLFTRYRVADDAATLRTLFDQDYDLASSLLVDEAPTFESGAADARGDVSLVTDEPESVVLHVRAGQPSLVLLNDSYDDGWSAEVDGQPARVLRANYAFRAVEVPAGEHDVRWAFRQRGLTVGIATTLAGLCALIVAAWVGVRKPAVARDDAASSRSPAVLD